MKMGVQYFAVCSCLCVVFSVVWCKPLLPPVEELSAAAESSEHNKHPLTSLPVLDHVDSIFSRVVASNTHDNQLDYQTYSGIQHLPASAKQQSLHSPLSKKSIPHPLSHNTPDKPYALNQNKAQLSDLTPVLSKEKLGDTKVKQNNFKNADIKSDAISFTSHMPKSDPSGELTFTKDRTKGLESSGILYETDGKNVGKNYQEFIMSDKNVPAVQLALRSSEAVQTATRRSVSDTIITLATSIAALFSVAVVIGIFGCCCKKKHQSDVNDNANKDNTELLEKNKTQPIPTVETELINESDIPTGEQDLDDFVSVKDKIKAFDTGKLVIQSSPDPAVKRKSQNDLLHDHAVKRKSENDLLHDNYKVPNMGSPPEEEVVMRDKTEQSKSKSLGDGLSKSDTQDDVSDKIFDNISMESSSISQPNNPDVVVAESDDEGEFAELQRGTVILKSFQRAKPPRNRSPATRTSKGKIRKSRPGLANDRGKSPSKPHSRDPSHDKEVASSPSSISVPPPSQGISSKTNSLDKQLNMSTSLTDSLEKRNGLPTTANSMDKSVDSLMVKSSDFNDFDSIMSKSVTSIGSDVHKKESPVSARNKKVKDSTNGDRAGRTDSPARSRKSKEKDIIGDKSVETRNESPSRYKKSKESPHGKRKHRKADKGNHVKKEEGLPTDISEGLEVKDTSVANRLSGLPPNVNNIFYLIDPTVKNKCKSVGDMTEDNNKQSNRRSGDYSKHHKKAKQRDEPEPSPIVNEDPVSPVKRERTQSDPSRKSKLIDQTQM